MKIDIITALPELIRGFLNESILRIAQEKELAEINLHDLRDWTHDRHRTVDDTAYGGGPGMIMKVEPFAEAIADLRTPGSLVIYPTPEGRIYDQKYAHELSCTEHIIIICGHYKGIDARIDNYIDVKISLGDFIITGGELPAAMITDSVCRLIPGVISDIGSALSDSFENGILDCSYYTRPPVYDGMNVPEVLMSGDHKAIDEWRMKDALDKTGRYRPDLIRK